MSADPKVVRIADYWKCRDCEKQVPESVDVCASCYYERDRCPSCKGEGVRDVGAPAPIGPEPCPDCDGEGFTYTIPAGRCQSCSDPIKHGNNDLCPACQPDLD